MNLFEAMEITGEICQPLYNNEPIPIKQCKTSHPVKKVSCEKIVCTNGKHFGIVGRPPNKYAIVWEDENKNAD